MWGATREQSFKFPLVDFNPRSPCGERLYASAGRCFGRISIHAPRVGSDRVLSSVTSPIDISIHAPRVGSDGYVAVFRDDENDFNPRSPCGERRSARQDCQQGSDFNPRSPCGERLFTTHILRHLVRFQSTLPVWGATHDRRLGGRQCQNFNPRSPCGERPLIAVLTPAERSFQSTLPVWGATPHCDLAAVEGKISIHAPRVGSDRYKTCVSRVPGNFNPRSPCGERPRRLCRHITNRCISIHAPRVGSDSARTCFSRPFCISIHAPRVGSDDGGGLGCL